MYYGPLLFGLLVAVVVLIGFGALWGIMRRRDPVGGRLEEYGAGRDQSIVSDTDDAALAPRRAWRGVNRLLAGFGLGPRLALALARADLPLTAAEFALITVGVGVLGFLIGTLRVGVGLGLVLGLLLGCIPYLYLRLRANRRQRAFTEQLPDVLTMLVGALRAGYGLSQALEMLVADLPPPASTEFARVMRAVGFGMPIQRALAEMAERIGTDDFYMVVLAMTAQYEMGGNLAQTLETIGQTVRDRLRILREIRVMTAQQRFTGYVLAVWPVVVAVGLFLLNPEYMGRLFQPDMLWLPAVAVVMQVIGFLIIRRIVDIEV